MPSAIIAATFDAHDTQVSAFTYRLEADWEGFAKAVAVIEIMRLGQAIHPMFEWFVVMVVTAAFSTT